MARLRRVNENARLFVAHTGKTVFTNKLEPMQFLTFEDETGLVEAAFFPGAYKRFHMILDWERPYLLEGVVDENFGAATLTISRIRKTDRSE